MDSFKYPNTKHQRQLSPPDGKPYRTYKSFLQIDFSGKCVYCRMPDSLKGADNFGVDHYKPKKRYRSLERVYTNLFYACNPCNRRKGDFWPGESERAVAIFIPNPCDHVMFDHLRFERGEVVGKSAAGKFVIETLDLNEEAVVEYRVNVIGLIQLVKTTLAETVQTEKELKKKIKSVSGETTVEFERDLKGLQKRKSELTKQLGLLTGEVLSS